MNKLQFTNRLFQWLNDYLIKNYSEQYNIEVLVLDSNISKLAHEKIKLIDGYTSFDFHTDIIGLLEHKFNRSACFKTSCFKRKHGLFAHIKTDAPISRYA